MKQILLFLISTILYFSAFAQKTNIEETIHDKMTKLPNNSEISVAIIENGEVDFYGMSKMDDSISSIKNRNRVFEIGSLTKVFAASLLSLEIKKERIKLTDTINPFYLFAFKNNVKLTFEELATHTSGLPRVPSNLNLFNFSNPYKDYDEEKLYDYLEDLLEIDTAKAGKEVAYSNLGYGILGYTLGLVEETSFQNLLEDEIFKRFGMNNSYTSTENVPNLVKSWDLNIEVVTNWEFDALFAAGGILSTMEDLAKFVLAQFDPENDFLTSTREPKYDIGQEMKIGLGWLIFQGKNGNSFYWHNGGTGGYTSFLIFDPVDKNAVIILSNVSAFNPTMQFIDELGYELMVQITEP